MLAGEGELGCARVVHEAIGKLLIRSDGQEAERGAYVIALGSQRGRGWARLGWTGRQGGFSEE